MSLINRLLRLALLGAGLLLLARNASAGGMAIDSAVLEPAARAKLAAEIEKFRAASPEAFAAVASVKGHRPEHYRNNRNPYPTATRELRGLGASALLPILEALAFDAPERGALTDAEWDALAVGMLEAVGVLRDARARPVLLAAFEAKHLRSPVLGATARALGRLGGDAELALLVRHAKTGDPLELHAIDGLGQIRRIESAKHLATRLASTKDPAVAAVSARALGLLGSSWAWRALGPKAHQQGLAVRRVCAEALARAMASQRSSLRKAVADSMLMVEHPDSIRLLNAARPGQGSAARAIDDLVLRVKKQQERSRR